MKLSTTELIRAYLGSKEAEGKGTTEIAKILSKRHTRAIPPNYVSTIKTKMKNEAAKSGSVSVGIEIPNGTGKTHNHLWKKEVNIGGKKVNVGWTVTQTNGDGGIADKIAKLKIAAEDCGGLAEAMRILGMMTGGK